MRGGFLPGITQRQHQRWNRAVRKIECRLHAVCVKAAKPDAVHAQVLRLKHHGTGGDAGVHVPGAESVARIVPGLAVDIAYEYHHRGMVGVCQSGCLCQRTLAFQNVKPLRLVIASGRGDRKSVV